MLTANGRVLVAFAALAAISGFVLGYPALIAIGFAFVLVLVVAAIWVTRRPRVDATRVVRPERVTIGGIAVSEMRIQNRSRRRTA